MYTTALSRIWALGAITILFHSFCSHSIRIISSHSVDFFSALAQLYDHLLHHKNIYCTTYHIRPRKNPYDGSIFDIILLFFHLGAHIAPLFVHTRAHGNVLTEVFSLFPCARSFLCRMQTFFFEIENFALLTIISGEFLHVLYSI